MKFWLGIQVDTLLILSFDDLHILPYATLTNPTLSIDSSPDPKVANLQS